MSVAMTGMADMTRTGTTHNAKDQEAITIEPAVLADLEIMAHISTTHATAILVRDTTDTTVTLAMLTEAIVHPMV